MIFYTITSSLFQYVHRSMVQSKAGFASVYCHYNISTCSTDIINNPYEEMHEYYILRLFNYTVSSPYVTTLTNHHYKLKKKPSQSKPWRYIGGEGVQLHKLLACTLNGGQWPAPRAARLTRYPMVP